MVDAIESTEVDGVRLADKLVEQPGVGAISSFMTPVQVAIENGAPVPTTDAEVKTLLESGLERIPAARSELVSGLFEGELAAGTIAPSGLLLAFFEAPTNADETACSSICRRSWSPPSSRRPSASHRLAVLVRR